MRSKSSDSEDKPLKQKSTSTIPQGKLGNGTGRRKSASLKRLADEAQLASGDVRLANIGEAAAAHSVTITTHSKVVANGTVGGEGGVASVTSNKAS